jgi:hypothetical protein
MPEYSVTPHFIASLGIGHYLIIELSHYRIIKPRFLPNKPLFVTVRPWPWLVILALNNVNHAIK